MTQVTLTSNRRAGYIPALDYDWLTPFYDRLVRLTMPERRFRTRLIGQARIADGMRVLDVGCGTGTLAIMMRTRFPNADLVGIDADEKILSIARRKAADAGVVAIVFEQALASELPFSDGSFDRIVSSLALHHLTSEEKRATLTECYRVLRPQGELHIADWGRPQNWLMWLASRSVLLFDGTSRTADNIRGRLPELCREAGFAQVTEAGDMMTVFGTLAFLHGRKPN